MRRVESATIPPAWNPTEDPAYVSPSELLRLAASIPAARDASDGEETTESRLFDAIKARVIRQIAKLNMAMEEGTGARVRALQRDRDARGLTTAQSTFLADWARSGIEGIASDAKEVYIKDVVQRAVDTATLALAPRV